MNLQNSNESNFALKELEGILISNKEMVSPNLIRLQGRNGYHIKQTGEKNYLGIYELGVGGPETLLIEIRFGENNSIQFNKRESSVVPDKKLYSIIDAFN
jgi:hypothetical protein